MEQLRPRVRFRDKVKRIWSPDEESTRSVEKSSSSTQSPPLHTSSQYLSNKDGRPPRELRMASRPRGLWDDAYDKIISSSESRNLKDFTKTLREDVRTRSTIDTGNIERLSTAASASPELAICRQVLSIVQEQTSIPQPKQSHILGKDLVIKECCSEIAASVQKFVDVGDIIAQVDPVHIGLPWAGIRLVLLLAIQNHTTEAVIYQGLGTISKLIYVYHIYEDYYLRGSYPVQGDLLEILKDNLVTLYGSILLFILEAQLYFRQHAASRTLMATATTGRLQTILDDITKNEELIRRFERLQLKRDANEQYLAMRKFLGVYDDFLDEKLRNDILAWISDMDYRGHHKGILERLMHGTGKWFFQRKEYIRWQQSTSSSLLWLRGDAGTGKSSLMASVIELHETEPRLDGKVAFAYVYCSRTSGDIRHQNPVDLMRCLLQQLSCPIQGLPLKSAVVKKYNHERSLSSRPGLLTLTECQELILELVKAEYTKATIIIDALDECQSQQREKLLRFLTRLIGESNAVLKILVSSRDGTEIADHFDKLASLHIDASDNEADIREYVDVQIENRLLSGKADPELKARVKTLLNAKAQGMFRWVELQVDSLCDPDDVQCEEDVEVTAGRLPQTLEATYLETLDKFNNYKGIKRDIVNNALKILLCAQRTLKVAELRGAISYGMDGRLSSYTNADITRISRSFIAIDEETRIYRFAHLSVREFLERQPEFSEQSAHALTATICLSCQLGSEAFTETTGTNIITQGQSMFEFEKYAFSYWGRHCCKAGPQRGCGELQKLLYMFLFGIDNGWKPFEKWCRAIPGKISDDSIPNRLQVELSHSRSPRFQPLFVICIYGFFEMIGETVISTSDVLDCFNMVGMNPLEVVAYHNNYEMTKELFLHAMRTRKSLEWGQSLLQNAARGCTDIKITQFLLQELQHVCKIEDVIIAAVQNQEHSTGMVRCVISTQPRNFSINETTMEDISENYRTSEAFQTCLKYFRGKTTSGIAKAIAGNASLSLDSMRMFLSRDTSFIITEELACYFVMRGQSFVELLFCHHKDFNVTPKTLIAAVPNYHHQDLTLDILLSKAKSSHFDEAFLIQVAAHPAANEMMPMITEVCPTLKITRPVLDAAMGIAYSALSVFMALSKRLQNSSDLIYSATTRTCPVQSVICLQERAPHAEITEVMLETAASKSCAPIMLHLLQQPRAFPVTMRMLFLALRNPNFGNGNKFGIAQLLKCMTEVEPSEDLMIAAVSQKDADTFISDLLHRFGSSVITGDVIQAALASGTATTELLAMLFSDTKTIEVSSDMLLLGAGCSTDALNFLLQRAKWKINITEDMVKMSVSRPPNLQILLSQPQRAKVSGATLESAAARGDLSALLVLLGTSEAEANKGRLVTAAARNVSYGAEVVRWLLSSGKVDIPEEAFLSAANNRGISLQGFHILKLLVGHSKRIHITEDLMIAAASNNNSGRELVELLLSRSSEPNITTKVLIAAAAYLPPNSSFSVLKVVLEHLRNDHLITEDVLASAAGNAHFGKENLQLLLARFPNDDVDEVMLKAVAISEPPEGYKDDDLYPNDDWASLYCRQDHVWPIEHVMEYLLERPTAEITPEVIRLVAGNRICGYQLMRLLLSHPKNRVSVIPSVTLMTASNMEQGDIIMKILIEERLEEIDITPNVILAAEANETCGKAILQRLLSVAVEKNDQDALCMLLRIIRSISHGIRDALFQVVYWGQMGALKVLLDEADLHEEIDGIGNVLHVASFRGKSEIVQFLLTEGFDINATGGPFRSALVASLHQSHQDTAKILIDAGASLEVIDSLGRTALHRAATADQVTLVSNLIQAGANIFALDKQKCSALHQSGMTGSLVSTKLLITSGISVLQTDSFGWTPLHWAARAKGPRVKRYDKRPLETLLSAGASKEATDSKGMTPFEIAAFFHNDHLLPTLRTTNQSPELEVGKNRHANCDCCDMSIYGDRYTCDTCYDFDFCYRCIVDAKQIHDPEHTFVCYPIEDDVEWLEDSCVVN